MTIDVKYPIGTRFLIDGRIETSVSRLEIGVDVNGVEICYEMDNDTSWAPMPELVIDSLLESGYWKERID